MVGFCQVDNLTPGLIVLINLFMKHCEQTASMSLTHWKSVFFLNTLEELQDYNCVASGCVIRSFLPLLF